YLGNGLLTRFTLGLGPRGRRRPVHSSWPPVTGPATWSVRCVSPSHFRGDGTEWRKGVAGARQRRGKLRTVAQEDAGHAVVGNPVDAQRRVDLGPEINGQEPIALEAPRSHQQEYAKGGITEAETHRHGLGKQADHGVDHVELAVDVAQLAAG